MKKHETTVQTRKTKTKNNPLPHHNQADRHNKSHSNITKNPHKDHKQTNRNEEGHETTVQTHKTKTSHKYHHHNQADRHNKVDSNIKHKPTQRPQ